MRVAVVTPYYRESPEVLGQCVDSVRAQTHPCEQFLVADGHPQPEVAARAAHHLVLPEAHGDNGNTPRAIGSLSAMNRGFDAIAYLDADNWYDPDHIASLLELHRDTGADVCISHLRLHRLDGTRLPLEQEERTESFADTSCMLLAPAAFRLAALWALMPQGLSPICDRIIWLGIQAGGHSVARSGRPTVAFRTQYAGHYRLVGEEPPKDAKSDIFSPCFEFWNGLSEAQREMYQRRMGFPLRMSMGAGNG